jgi:hypothetical protein
VKTNEIMKSFQIHSGKMHAVAASPGVERGRVSRGKVPRHVHPFIKPDSSMSTRKTAKNPLGSRQQTVC